MGLPLIDEFLTGDSKELREIASNEAVLTEFLELVKGIDDLPDMKSRFYEEPRSLYQITANGHSLDALTAILSRFFGKPVKSPGKSLPVTLRFDPTVKFLGGIRKDQALFFKKLKTGTFYGALWPWQRDPNKIEVLLGFCSPGISAEDYSRLGSLVQKYLSQKKIETVSGIGGQIHGISLPSFLQMSEMEGATYSLKVTSGNCIGYLYLDGGSLIAAQYEDQTGNEAAYRIISWDNAAIQIEAADPGRAKEIHEPLMHVMMESLKIKDEAGPQPPPPPQAKKTQPPEPAVETKKSQSPPKPVRKAPNSPEAAPAQQAAAPPLPSKSAVAKPFEKAIDRSAGRQAQMSRQNKLMILLGIVIVFAVVVTVGGKMIRNRQLNHRYNQLIAELATTRALDAQIVMLMQYLNAYPHDVHRAELEARLKETNLAIERQDFEKTMADVDQLPIDDKYEDKALSLYTAFLNRYPESQYKKKINAAIGGIRKVVGDSQFESLKKLAGADYSVRYAAYHAYLQQFPQSRQHHAVEQMITDLAAEYTSAIEKQTLSCDDRKNWDPCIAQCDRFLATYTDKEAVEKVTHLRSVLQDKKDVADLEDKADRVADDYAKAKALYSDYLKKHPDTTQKETLVRQIHALKAKLGQKALWEKTAAYAANPAHDIFKRIQRLDSYLEDHASEAYAAPAKHLRSRLEPELEEAVRAQRVKEEKRRVLARQQKEQVRRAKEAQRLQKLRDWASRQLRTVAKRFVDNGDGTVTDRVTGLTWCLLDSSMELENCISFKAAKAYVQRLNTGGHSDWRLPTASELAAIYKSKPFFPGTDAEWYWTSESFARGFHRVVDVVTSAPETVFKRTFKTEDSCGVVRAVRE
jgi:hypothetical protein